MTFSNESLATGGRGGLKYPDFLPQGGSGPSVRSIACSPRRFRSSMTAGSSSFSKAELGSGPMRTMTSSKSCVEED